MNQTEKITSLQNPKIKNIVKLQKASERKKQKLFVVEGLKEIKHVTSCGYELHSLYFCPEIAPDGLPESVIPKVPQAYEVSSDVFSKIAYRETTGGMIALAYSRFLTLDELKLSKIPLIVVLEHVEKPGNLGAILRTADAAQVDAVIICDPATDLYNPNVIRASIGCVFSTQVVSCSSEEAMEWLKEKNIRSFAAAIQTNKWYHESNYDQPSALIMGTESEGLSQQWRDFSDEIIKIPMMGINDSLNVSIATAILIYEAMRQRDFKK
ncbi:MAG: RNA methyltransferase [Bacteroidales bacterium]|nr:RNA methyltransferase [Bacteroidales bacterium]